MKKAVLMLTVIMLAPVLTRAQSHWSVSPAIGFYKADLGTLSDELSLAESFGATVQKPNGSFHFGGRVHYEKSPRWSWLGEVSLWKDKAAGHIQNEFGSWNFEGQVRLTPIMIGSQYYFSQPEKQVRFYAGATGGVVLVDIKNQYTVVTPGAGSVSEADDLSGNDFVARPFAGLEISQTSKMSFWGELGYMLGKYSIETTAPETGEKTKEQISINGLHITGGVKFRL